MNQNNKYKLYFILTNQCELNCYSCEHNCGIYKNAWFISLKEVENNLQILKKEMKNLQELILIGGEPLMHPQIKEICLLIRKYFPKLHCSIGTNGIKLFNNLLLSKFLTDLKFDINISIYPVNLEKYELLFNELDTKNIPYNYQSSKVLFSKIILDKQGKQSNNTIICSKIKNNPIFTLYKNKIYNCELSCCFDAFNFPEKENIDFIKLQESNLEEKIYKLYENQQFRCKYCITSSEGLIPWHKKLNRQSLFNSLKELFLYNYNDYEYIQHDLTDVELMLKSKKFLKEIDPNFKKQTQKILSRYYSKKDFFILIDSNSEFYPIKEILNLNYCKENIYIILLNNNLDILNKYFNHIIYENQEKDNNNYFLFRANKQQDFFKIIFSLSYGENKYIIRKDKNE